MLRLARPSVAPGPCCSSCCSSEHLWRAAAAAAGVVAICLLRPVEGVDGSKGGGGGGGLGRMLLLLVLRQHQVLQVRLQHWLLLVLRVRLVPRALRRPGVAEESIQRLHRGGLLLHSAQPLSAQVHVCGQHLHHAYHVHMHYSATAILACWCKHLMEQASTDRLPAGTCSARAGIHW